MTDYLNSLIDRLASNGRLSLDEYEALISARTPELAQRLAALAISARQKVYGNKVFIRALIEISNVCKNDCLYCGIRRSNRLCERYRLSEGEILDCCDEGYSLGFRTFVLQGGEDGFFTDTVLCRLVSSIKQRYPDCAVTLSLGERSHESYAALREAGADRYLLRHETADKTHYERLHPADMSYNRRIGCLKSLKELGYQVGCGFMVGSPYQTARELALDLKFVEEFQPDMCGIGPFIPQKDTPFGDKSAGTLELTLYLLSILRLIRPTLLLPSTTALASIHPDGREMGILSGANVVMPNLSPVSVRKKYSIYDNKATDLSESSQNLDSLKKRIRRIGYEIVTDRGDVIKNKSTSDG